MTGTPLFTGVCTAMITPFRGGQIDYPALDGLLERQISAKVDALLIAGTTGEPSTLSDAEWESLTAHALTRIAGRVRVIPWARAAITCASPCAARALPPIMGPMRSCA